MFRDEIYKKAWPGEKVSPFEFDQAVSRVFSDMISRSVPGYQQILESIGLFTRLYVKDPAVCWDLGCSLGAATLAIRRNLKSAASKVIGIDNSQAMIDRCKENLARDNSAAAVDLRLESMLEAKIQEADLVVCNFTLQFLPPGDRLEMLKKIHAGLKPGGVFILAEKICFEDASEQERFTEWHHSYKKLQGYSDLEIAQKRESLEEVLIPDTAAKHRERLEAAGFVRFSQWFSWFNFSAFIAFKA